MEEPLKLTIAPWHNKKRGKNKRDSMGFQDDKWMKAFALKDRPVDSYAYGTVTEGYSGTQAGIVCAPHTGLLVIDVDDHETFDWSLVEGMKPTTKTGGGGFHYYVDGRGVPADQWPTQGPIAGGDIKSNGFVPAPGTRHWNGRMYEPIGDPAETLYVGTPELFARLRAARAAHDASRTRSERASVGLGASQQHGDDNALTRLVFDYAQILDDERLYALWQHEARKIEDPADPFEREDFERHLKGAREKLGPPVDPDSLHWYMDPSKGGGVEQADALPDAVEKLVKAEYLTLKVRDLAKERLVNEKLARSFTPPEASESLAEALTTTTPEIAYLVDQLIGENDNVIMAAKYKTGKTTLLASVLHGLADVTPMLGAFNVTDPGGRIGVWNCEMNRNTFLNYVRPVGIEHPERIALANLRGVRVPFLSSRPARDWTIKWLIENEITTWVVDSWSRLSQWNGVEVNNNDQAINLGQAIDEIKAAAGVRVFLGTAHTPKHQVEGEESALGAQNLSGWADAIWMLTRVGSTRFLSVEGRDAALDETELTHDARTNRLYLSSGDRQQHRESAAYTDTVAFVVNHPGASTGEIKAGVHRNALLVTQALTRASQAGGPLRMEQQGNAKRYWPTAGGSQVCSELEGAV